MKKNMQAEHSTLRFQASLGLGWGGGVGNGRIIKEGGDRIGQTNGNSYYTWRSKR
jgi:hypothetical protein